MTSILNVPLINFELPPQALVPSNCGIRVLRNDMMYIEHGSVFCWPHSIPGLGFGWHGPTRSYDSYYTTGYISELSGSHEYSRFISRNVER